MKYCAKIVIQNSQPTSIIVVHYDLKINQSINIFVVYFVIYSFVKDMRQIIVLTGRFLIINSVNQRNLGRKVPVGERGGQDSILHDKSTNVF